MVQRKMKKDLLKMLQKSRKFGKKMMKSTVSLYVVLLLALVNIFVLVQKQDNESLFLFLIISTLVYTQSTNMILVLLIPLIFVNLLIFLRKMFMKSYEGFDMESPEKVEEFKKWLSSVVAPSKEEDPKGYDFYKKEVEEVIDVEKIKELYASLDKMSKEEPSDSPYIKNMVDDFVKKYKPKKEPKKETTEETTQETSEDSEENEDTADVVESFAPVENYEGYEGYEDYDEDEEYEEDLDE